MKKSELKQLIREVITEISREEYCIAVPQAKGEKALAILQTLRKQRLIIGAPFLSDTSDRVTDAGWVDLYFVSDPAKFGPHEVSDILKKQGIPSQ